MGRSRRKPQTQQFPAASCSSTTMFPTKRQMISSSINPLEKTSAPISAYSKTAPNSQDSQSDNGMQAKAMKKRRRTAAAAAAAHSHKLANKRRRDKFNKRMRALQNLIPNCTKMDEESVLDEAIYYLKSLQLQLQIMPNFAGLCVPPTQHPSFYQLF